MNSINKLGGFQKPVFSEIQDISQQETQTVPAPGFIGTSDSFETFQPKLLELKPATSENVSPILQEEVVDASSLFENLTTAQESQPLDIKIGGSLIAQTPGSVAAGSQVKIDGPIFSEAPPASAGKVEAIKTPESERFTQMLNDFKTQFQSFAADPQKFHQVLSEIYKPAYSYEKAEAIRNRALSGDYKWIPQVKFVSSKSVADLNGVYTEGPPATMFVNERLLKDPAEAARVFTRGIGFHLDHLTNKSLGDFIGESASGISYDSETASIGSQMSGIDYEEVPSSTTLSFNEARGNEGEKFRAALAGEPTTLDANSEHTMKLIINGRTVECEVL